MASAGADSGGGVAGAASVAARAVRRGLRYRADLLTEAIPDVEPLADLWRGEALDVRAWRRVGACLRRFHDAGYFHADLNAHNVLLDGEGRVFVLDFDRGRRRPQGAWRRANLARLARSLRKLAPAAQAALAEGWSALQAGYRGA